MSSAYGPAPPRPTRPTLSSTFWPCSTQSKRAAIKSPRDHITVHHITLTTARTFPGLIPFLAKAFELEIRIGRTYPQEDNVFFSAGTTGDTSTVDVVPAFEAYFFAGDVFIGIFDDRYSAFSDGDAFFDGGLANASGGRSWEDCVAGFYYVCQVSYSDNRRIV